MQGGIPKKPDESDLEEVEDRSTILSAAIECRELEEDRELTGLTGSPPPEEDIDPCFL